MAIDPADAERYPPNIQAILKRPAPAAVLLGQELLAVDAEAGTVSVAYNTVASLANRFGAIHGGMTAAMMDDVMSVAAGLSIVWGEITPTLEMKVSYISQATPGARLIAEARTVRRGKTVVFLEADIKTAEGKLVATASSTVMVTQMKR
jgi:uncharacterized protein (TIGR00369 family)